MNDRRRLGMILRRFETQSDDSVGLAFPSPKVGGLQFLQAIRIWSGSEN
jgi:hypothetical protein